MIAKTAQNFPSNQTRMSNTGNTSRFELKNLFTWFKDKESDNYLDASITHHAIFNELCLRIRDDARIVTVDTATALNLLCRNSNQVHVINSNISDQAKLEIQCKAIVHLVDYAAVLKFLTFPNQSDNLKRYQRHLQKQLSPQAFAYWEKKNLFGQARYTQFKKNSESLLPQNARISATSATYPQAPLPLYLQEAEFIQLRKKIKDLHQHPYSLLGFLQEQESASIGSFFLKDQVNQLSKEEMLAICHEIHRCALPGAQIILQSQDETAILDCILAAQLEKHWYLSRSIAPFFVFSKR